VSNKIIVDSINGNLIRGGSIARCRTEGDADVVQYGDAIRITDPDLQFVYINGHVMADPDIAFDGLNSTARFNVGTADAMLSGRLQAIGFTEQATPANSHQIAPTMRFSSIVQHILESHTNLIYNATTMPDGPIIDADYDTGNDVAINRYNVYETNNLWSTLVNSLSGGETGGIQFYRPYFTRDNAFRYKATPHHRAASITSKGTFTKSTILGRVRVTQNSRKFGQAQVSGVSNGDVIFDAVDPASPLDGAIWEIFQGVYTDSQARSDGQAEGLYKWLSRLYTVEIEVRPELLLHEGLDIGDKVVIDYDGPAEDIITGHGMHIDFNNHEFIIYGYDVQFEPEFNSGRAFLTLESVE